ncbi:proline-specific peptidase [Hyaloraphidium curvatum]|nr:proline-specific peptidase [Hyaloraphidium curvatum]
MAYPKLVPIADEQRLGMKPADTQWFPADATVREYWLELRPDRRVWIQVVGAEKLGSSIPPLFTLHGGPGACHDYLIPLALAAKDRPVIFWDQTGCGYSTVPPTAELDEYGNIPYYVGEVVAVRKALDLDKIHLWGSSWGSMLAVEYLLREQPVGVVSVTLAGSALDINRWQADADAYVAQLPEEHRNAIAEALKTGDYKSAAFLKATDAFNAKHLCRTDPVPECISNSFAKLGEDVYTRMNGETEYLLSGTFKGYVITPRLKELPEIVPSILYSCGDYDEATPATSAYYHRCTPDSELAVIPQSSHCHHAEQPEVYQAILNSFIRRAEAKLKR